jgi:predicted secreted hydrolase
MVDHGVSLRVTGRSWMDHEWSNTLSGAAGWDWFSVQLDNGTQYMLQFIRTKRAGIVAASGTRARAAGVDYLTKGRIGEQASGSWTSPVTGYTYARHWRLRVPGGDLEVAPLLADQEVDLRKVQGTVYWEGDCVITGTIGGKPVTGVGYTEINPPGQLG